MPRRKESGWLTTMNQKKCGPMDVLDQTAATHNESMAVFSRANTWNNLAFINDFKIKRWKSTHQIGGPVETRAGASTPDVFEGENDVGQRQVEIVVGAALEPMHSVACRQGRFVFAHQRDGHDCDEPMDQNDQSDVPTVDGRKQGQHCSSGVCE